MTLNFNFSTELVLIFWCDDLLLVHNFECNYELWSLFSRKVNMSKFASTHRFSYFKIINRPLLSIELLSRLQRRWQDWLLRRSSRTFVGIRILRSICLLRLQYLLLFVFFCIPGHIFLMSGGNCTFLIGQLVLKSWRYRCLVIQLGYILTSWYLYLRHWFAYFWYFVHVLQSAWPEARCGLLIWILKGEPMYPLLTWALRSFDCQYVVLTLAIWRILFTHFLFRLANISHSNSTIAFALKVFRVIWIA